MNSPAFKKALLETEYLQPDGEPVLGLVRAGEVSDVRFRSLFSDERVGLKADAVFSTQSTPTSIFKDAGRSNPSESEIAHWHEAAWNIGVAPLLWIITPTEVRLFDCYSSPIRDQPQQISAHPLGIFNLDSENSLQRLKSTCGRLVTETGAFWSSDIGKKIDRRYRVDRELLTEINALEELLTKLAPAGMRPLRDGTQEIKSAREFAQRLIGRCIFTSYLVDRGIVQRFLPPNMAANVVDMCATVESTFKLFEWLRATFNGDLFPMDDPGAERERLGEAHLSLLREFLAGRSLISGQGRLFRFRFDAIPVDLISSIYQQFARSSAAEEVHVQGLHYTPIELVHLALDPVFEGLSSTARVLDPTCGSGAFLVEAFRRLVWKRAQGKHASRALVRDVLYKQLYGIDINKAALGIAAFSLYLAALELTEEAVTNVQDLKFDRLIGRTLFEADTLSGILPSRITERPFDAVIGNPPWTFVRRSDTNRADTSTEGRRARPRRSPDQEFLWVASTLVGQAGRISMVMKASPFFSRDQHAVRSREALFNALAPIALVNLSALRKEGLFPDATGPALIFFARCALSTEADRILVGSVPWTPDFRRNGVFHVGPGEFKRIPLARVLGTPAVLKAATFGTVRDGWLIEKLERSFPTFEALLDSLGVSARGQGFQVKGGGNNKPPGHYYKLRVLTANNYTPLRLEEGALSRFDHRSLHRTRDPSIFEGPLLLCPKGTFKRALEQGRYSASFTDRSVLYNESFYGISFTGQSTVTAKVLCGVLNSSVVAFQLSLAGGAWGLERPTVEPADLLAIRVPPLKNIDKALFQAALKAEQALAKEPDSAENRAALDAAVAELYGLENDELVVANESVARARMTVFEGRAQRAAFTTTPSSEVLASYATQLTQTINAYMRARGKRHMEAVIYPREPVSADAAIRGLPGIVGIKLSMVDGPPTQGVAIRQGSDEDLARLLRLVGGLSGSEVPPYLNERRQLRIYGDRDLYIVKPAEVRYWTRTAGLNDADIVLADHWMDGRHAVVS